jgi:osmotically-inducible protein OsmY
MLTAHTNSTIPTDYSRCDERSLTSVEAQNEQRNADKIDKAITQKVDDALWKDGMLRSGDYHEIEVAVRDSIVTLSGNVMSTSNLQRAENAAKIIQGVQGVRNNLVADDELIRNVAGALGQIEHNYGVKFFTGARNGVVVLNGEVDSPNIRLLAEKCAACIPGVRGVHNFIRCPGVNLKKVEQRFLQPIIGEQIYFRNYLSGIVDKVIINPDNMFVTAMVINGRYLNSQGDLRFMTYDQVQPPKKSVVVPMNAIRILTKSSGFLRIDSVITDHFRDFDPSQFTVPQEDWTPPYPYCPDDVLFEAGNAQDISQTENEPVIEPVILPQYQPIAS